MRRTWSPGPTASSASPDSPPQKSVGDHAPRIFEGAGTSETYPPPSVGPRSGRLRVRAGDRIRLEVDAPREERRFARWICKDCLSFRFAPIPADGLLKRPICYATEPFRPKRH